MKTKTIIMTSLLAFSMLSFSGCDFTDSLDPDEYFANVNVVSQYSTSIEATVGDEKKNIPAQGQSVSFTEFTTGETVYIEASSIPKIGMDTGVINVFGFSDNCTNGYLIDTANDNKIHIMNLSDTAVSRGNLKITFVPEGSNVVQDVSLPNVGVCQNGHTFTGSTIGTWTVQIGSGSIESVDIKKDISVEFVIYDVTNQKGTAVPLISLHDLK